MRTRLCPQRTFAVQSRGGCGFSVGEMLQKLSSEDVEKNGKGFFYLWKVKVDGN